MVSVDAYPKPIDYSVGTPNWFFWLRLERLFFLQIVNWTAVSLSQDSDRNDGKMQLGRPTENLQPISGKAQGNSYYSLLGMHTGKETYHWF